jgi:hypothetical protein
VTVAESIVDVGPGSADSPLIVWYVSGHGFGHGARSGLVMRELRRLAPRIQIMARTVTPSWLYPAEVQRTPVEVDVGVLQADSLTMLVDETIVRAAEFERARPAIVSAEANAVTRLHASAVVGDIPPLAFDVAAEIGVPGLAIGNFSWDWIYARLGNTHPEVDEVVESIRASERRTTLLFRLPFHDEMAAFPRREDVSLIANVSRADRRATRRRLGLPEEEPVVLISYGGFALRRLEPSLLGAVHGVTFVTTTPPTGIVPPNVVTLPLQTDGYRDLLAACDAVMMKPGYGTVADCIANRVPMIYTSRPGFGEEAVLVGAMERFARAVALPPDDLFAGRIRPAVEQALALGTPWAPMDLDGATVIARRILEMSGLAGYREHPCGAPTP